MYAIAALFSMWGSPPHGRGKVHSVFKVRKHHRITPAWAGKSSRVMVLPSCRMGSPPRRRGKGAGFPALPQGQGITPAWAGKSCMPLPRCFRCGDHPRMGGEKCIPFSKSESITGSPPRGRGKELGFHIVAVKIGITPAWAGKRPWMPSDSSSSRDHPRVGGEKRARVLHRPDIVGSPPHGRGKDLCFQINHLHEGITPA